MNWSFWVYLHRSEGFWERRAWAWWDRFLEGRDRIPKPSGKWAEIAELIVDKEGPIPVDLCRIVFIRIPILRDGTLNRKRYEAWSRASTEASKAKMLLASGPQGDRGVKRGRAKTAECRMPYEGGWEPTRLDRKTLQAELARRGLTWGGGKGSLQWGA